MGVAPSILLGDFRKLRSGHLQGSISVLKFLWNKFGECSQIPHNSRANFTLGLMKNKQSSLTLRENSKCTAWLGDIKRCWPESSPDGNSGAQKCAPNAVPGAWSEALPSRERTTVTDCKLGKSLQLLRVLENQMAEQRAWVLEGKISKVKRKGCTQLWKTLVTGWADCIVSQGEVEGAWVKRGCWEWVTDW